MRLGQVRTRVGSPAVAAAAAAAAAQSPAHCSGDVEKSLSP